MHYEVCLVPFVCFRNRARTTRSDRACSRDARYAARYGRSLTNDTRLFPLLIGGIRQESDPSRSFQSCAQLSLMFRAVARNAPWNDFPPLRGEVSQFVPFLVINMLDLISAKAAHFSSDSSFLVFTFRYHPKFLAPARFQPVLSHPANEQSS
jgi:hypothetical protein